MTRAPTLDDIFLVMSAASIADRDARVALPEVIDPDEPVTRTALALNVLLDDLAARARAAERELAERQRMADRLRLLSEAARQFSEATQDLDRLFFAVGEQLATIVRDFCAVLLVSEDGRALEPVSLNGPKEAVARAREMFAEPLLLADHAIARKVHESGVPFLAPVVDRAKLGGEASPRAATFGSRMGTHSLIFVPLRAQGTSFGQLALIRYRPETPPFDEHDLHLARGLADHAALAISNARAQGAIRDSEARYRLMFDASPLPKWMYDSKTLRFLAVNDAAVQEYGYSRDEFLAMTLDDIRPPDDVPAMREMATRANPGPTRGVWTHRKKNGQLIQVELTAHSVSLGKQRCRLVVARDLTERTRLEEQLRQSQKMEAVGQLAGGVAHDFNNLLSVILSCSELALAEIAPDAPVRGDLEDILRAGQRAAELTKQLLTFSRQRVMAPKVLIIDSVLLNMDKMLRRLIGEDIELVTVASSAHGRVRVDPSSLEQMIVNLVVNARDAMPTGGRITVETLDVVLDDAFVKQHLGAAAGPHVMLAVTDTGIGMDAATKARIFEPFFSTKEQGKGTGLGLSTVFGIVRQCGGSIWVYSEPGKGTTFKIYIPRVDDALDTLGDATAPTTRFGDETILLVEDDEAVRGVACAILQRHGYQVLEAAGAAEAAVVSDRHSGRVDLLLSDVVMPHTSGPEMAKRLAVARPTMRVLFMSGYTDESVVRHGLIAPSAAYLQKPLTPETLTRKVREVLDRK